MSATFASMRYVNYRYWFVASLIASTGVWLQRVAQDWYVLTVLTDHDASQVGVVTALQFLPIILFSAWAGVLADRYRRPDGDGRALAPVRPGVHLGDDLRRRYPGASGLRG